MLVSLNTRILNTALPHPSHILLPGTYQIIKNGVNITTGISSASPVSVKLKLDACAEIVETRVEDGRVRGRISAVGYGGLSKEARGWIDLFEPTCRWAKIVCFQGGRPIAPQS